MVGITTNDPFSQQQQTHTRIARFRFVKYAGWLYGWVPAANINVSYADTHDKHWQTQQTSLNGKVAIVCTYPVDLWKKGVVLQLSWQGTMYAFDMTEINHTNDDYIEIRINA